MSGPRVKASSYYNPALAKECGQVLVEREWGWSIPTPTEAEGIAMAYNECARLRERVKALLQRDISPPLAKDAFALAVREVLALLAEPGEEGS